MRCFRLAVALAVLSLGVALAQSTEDAGPEAAGQDSAEVQELTVAAFGIAGGLPGYQAATALASVQYKWTGLAIRAGYGTAGVQASLDVRGYPPIPVPVPIYGALGVNIYGEGLGYHASFGAHLPITLQWRLDVEAGLAFAAFANGRSLAPQVLLGVSYAIPFDPAILASSRPAAATDAAGTPAADAGAPCEPASAGVDRAVAAVVQNFLEDAQAGYGSVYTDLRYTYRIAGTTVSGDRASVEVAYGGSVVEIGTGERIPAEGVATLDLAWADCSWSSAGVSY